MTQGEDDGGYRYSWGKAFLSSNKTTSLRYKSKGRKSMISKIIFFIAIILMARGIIMAADALYTIVNEYNEHLGRILHGAYLFIVGRGILILKNL